MGGGDLVLPPVGVIRALGDGLPILDREEDVGVPGVPPPADELSRSDVDLVVVAVVIVVNDEEGVERALTLGEDVPLLRP